MWNDLLRAFCLVLVLEGLWPMLVPDRWREMLLRISQVENRHVRLAGAVAVSGGLLLLHLLRD
jgi:uncharacterized protein YjeT (DUF2065 family)